MQCYSAHFYGQGDIPEEQIQGFKERVHVLIGRHDGFAGRRQDFTNQQEELGGR